MRDALRRRIEDADRTGGRLFFRFWGTLILLAVLVVALPVLVGTLLDRNWTGVLVAAAFTVAGLVFVRYLFSRDRRLSEIE